MILDLSRFTKCYNLHMDKINSLKKKIIGLIILVMSNIAIMTVFFVIVFAPSAPENVKEQVITFTLTTLVGEITGIIGYLFGRHKAEE